MSRPQYRWLLPVGHLFIDSIALALWIWQGATLLDREKAAVHSRQESHSSPGPGEVAFIPPGVRHQAGNCGDTVARVLEIYAPAGEDFHIVDDSENK